MASLKKLAGQTVWYGLSSIAAKFLNQLLTPIITRALNESAGMADYGKFGSIMAYISFINVVYTYGMETAYFRFSSQATDKKNLFQTAFTSLIISTFALSILLICFRVPLARLAYIGEHPEYIIWCVLIIAIDTMAAIPFARLRQEERPRKYAFVRVAGIIVNIVLTIYLVVWCPSHITPDNQSAFAQWYRTNNNVGFLLLANLAASAVTFLLLFREWIGYRFRFDVALWKKLIVYSAPMVIIGLGGMINETMDRIMLPRLLPGTRENAEIQNGIYGANYKIAIFITLFITAFRMSAEPFFFNQAHLCPCYEMVRNCAVLRFSVHFTILRHLEILGR